MRRRRWRRRRRPHTHTHMHACTYLPLDHPVEVAYREMRFQAGVRVAGLPFGYLAPSSSSAVLRSSTQLEIDIQRALSDLCLSLHELLSYSLGGGGILKIQNKQHSQDSASVKSTRRGWRLGSHTWECQRTSPRAPSSRESSINTTASPPSTRSEVKPRYALGSTAAQHAPSPLGREEEKRLRGAGDPGGEGRQQHGSARRKGRTFFLFSGNFFVGTNEKHRVDHQFKPGHTYVVYIPHAKETLKKGYDVRSLSRGQWATRPARPRGGWKGKGINTSPSGGALHGLHRRTTSCVADRWARVQEQQKAVRQYEEKSPRCKEREMCVQ